MATKALKTLQTPEEIGAEMAGLVAKKLGRQPEQVERDIAMSKLGLDSTDVVELFQELGDRLNMELEQTIAWDYPTIDGMADHLSKQRLNSAITGE